MRIPPYAVFLVAVVALVAMGAYHALGEVALLRTLFYLSVAALVCGLAWILNSDD